MTYHLLTLLDWAMIAVSLFNTVVLLWLGLTVLLNAERRTWGAWVAGGGLLFGAAFFIGHTAVVGRVIGSFSGDMELWWWLGWLVLLGAPYLWYLVMAWYSGALRTPTGRRWLGIASGVGLAALATLVFGNPLPAYGDLVDRGARDALTAGSLPIVSLIYPVYSITCTLLALAVLHAPADSERFMGAEARRRARPWLVAATWMLLLVGLAVGSAATWVLQQLGQDNLPQLSPRLLAVIISFDLGVSLLIAATIVLIGQAIVAYEIFTGKVLPRGALRVQWQRTLMLAVGYGIVIGWSLSGAGIPELPIYQILLATTLMTTFYALLGWRMFEEREHALGSLRPFVAGRRLYEGLVRPTAPPDGAPAQNDDGAAFRALCGELLGAGTAYLIPLGSLAPLAGPPLALPTTATPPSAAAAQLALNLPPQPPLCLPVEPATYGAAIWAVPLTGAGGIIGLLLLGEKRDGGLYTEEEIDLARAASERIVDGQAGAEMARRLVMLQRRRLSEDQLLDRRARRTLHDEVLPRIHAAMLGLAAGAGNAPATLNQLAEVHKQISDLLHSLPPAIGPAIERHGPLGALRRAIAEELVEAFDQVDWEICASAEVAAARLDPLHAEALFYALREAVRNAARHGRGDEPERRLGLRISATCQPGHPDSAMLSVQISDDGIGIVASTAEQQYGGARAGLTLHGTILAILGGALTIESTPGGTSVTANLPLQ
jgi:signal transduction histidine kinase